MDKKQNLHKLDNGNYGLGVWSENKGQYQCPLTKEEAKLSGCFMEFSRLPMGDLPYKKAAALARKLWGYVKSN